MGLLNRLFGRAKGKQRDLSEMTPAMAEKIVLDYMEILASSSGPAPGCVADVCGLPHPKGRIKQALLFALLVTEDQKIRSALEGGYISLADWQEGVGDKVLGLDTAGLDINGELDEVAKIVLSQASAMEKWQPAVQAELEALNSDLEKLHVRLNNAQLRV